MDDLSTRSLKLLEGFRSTRYRDAHGHSIGFGHFIKPGEEQLMTAKLSREQAEAFLKKDIETHQSGLKKWARRPMSEQQRAAITSLAYNIGAEAKGVKKIIDLYNAGKDKEAAAAFADYNQAYNPNTGRKEVNESLVKRREFERRMFTATGPVDVEALYKETHGEQKGSLVAVESSRALSKPGSMDTAMNQNRDVFAQLQEMNRGLSANMDPNSEFMQKLRREGGSGGYA